ncbi:hypothetical protein ABZ611_30885 [Streptomyces sp. NPDC007861]|uniref:hypothetical protein n=1 Tax=Streptomyces sp. NPDC007861 TaxID=3154893 RepID=UPI0033D56929
MSSVYPWTANITATPYPIKTGEPADYLITLTNNSDQPSGLWAAIGFQCQLTYTEAISEDTTRVIEYGQMDGWPLVGSLDKGEVTQGDIEINGPEIWHVDKLLNKRPAVKYVVHSKVTADKAKELPGGTTVSFRIRGLQVAPLEGDAVVIVAFGDAAWQAGDETTYQPQYFSFQKSKTGELQIGKTSLSWEAHTDEKPINAGGENSGFSFGVYASKGSVTCTRIAVKAEIGEKSTSLCATKDDLGTAGPPQGWKTDKVREGELFAFQPVKGKVTISKTPVVFQIPVKRISSIPGAVDLEFFDDSQASVGKIATSKAMIPKAIVKHAPGFTFAHLAPMLPAIQNGQTVKLSWDAQNVVRYILHTSKEVSADPALKDPFPGHKQVETPRLSKTTGFVLEAFSDAVLSHSLATTVDVLGGENSSYDTIEVTGALDLNTIYHHIAPIPYNLSNQKGQKLPLDDGTGEKAAGDRCVVIGLAEPVTGDARGANLGKLALLVINGSTEAVLATLYLDGTGSPATFRLPLNTPLAIKPNEEWQKNQQETNLTAKVSLALTDPRLAPAP